MNFFRSFAGIIALSSTVALFADDTLLTKDISIDFFRDVTSRNLKGLATRSDGRLVSGPVLTDLSGNAIADTFWCLEPGASPEKWLLGTGPDGKIFEVTIDEKKSAVTSREIADLEEPQIFALKRLPDGSILAGTSPKGVLALIKDSKVTAKATLPVDSIFDIVSADDQTAYLATGNPGRVYRLDLKKFAGSGIAKETANDEKALAARGFTQLGEIRDRNVRRLTLLDGRLIAGSSPKGNIYAFALTSSATEPLILLENREAEVTALLPQADGSFYAALVYAPTTGDNRVNRDRSQSGQAAPAADKPASTPPGEQPSKPANPGPGEKFTGRSAVVYFPKDGFPETVVARNNLAFYSLALQGDTVLVSGGEQGDLLGYETKSRQSLTFAGSAAAQLYQVEPIAKSGRPTGRFLAIRNNAPGLALIDFTTTGERSAETRRIDLGAPAEFGALRLGHLRGISADKIQVEVRVSTASDEIEGWSNWTKASLRDDGWFVPNLRGRYLKLRLKLPENAATAVIDKGTLYHLPQNRRPQLAEFRVISPNFALIPPGESSPSPVTKLSQIASADRADSGRREGNIMGSTIVPQRGSQIVLWNVSDPDNDNLACTFSIRPEGSDAWTDISIDNRESYVQFDISHLDDGYYQTRLLVSEQAPRPAADRITTLFDTDTLVVDKTPPVLGDTKVTRDGNQLVISISGRDALSLLEGTDFTFNNGYSEHLTQPADGIRDSQAETFVLRVPVEKTLGATSVEIVLYDEFGNSSARRLQL